MKKHHNAPVLTEVNGPVGWVTLNRPEVLNAMNAHLMNELRLALERLADTEQIRCVVLQGAGRAFSAGGDVGMMKDRQDGVLSTESVGALFAAQQKDLEKHSESSVLLRTMPKPTIASLHGHVVGGALALALACDFRIAANSTRLRVGFAGQGLSGDFGIAYLLHHAVGSLKARELLMLNHSLEAEQALELGLLTEVCTDEALTTRVAEIAERLGSGPTIAYGRIKANLERAAVAASLRDSITSEALNQRVSAMTSDSREAGAAFLEKRPPNFTGQ